MVEHISFLRVNDYLRCTRDLVISSTCGFTCGSPIVLPHVTKSCKRLGPSRAPLIFSCNTFLCQNSRFLRLQLFQNIEPLIPTADFVQATESLLCYPALTINRLVQHLACPPDHEQAWRPRPFFLNSLADMRQC